MGTAPTTTSTTTTVASTTTSPQPFDYRIGMTRDVATLNPWASWSETADPWTTYVLERTVASLYAPLPDRPQVEARLATDALPEPVESADGQWEVELGIAGRWSDGTPLTAEDMVFTFATVRRFGLGGQWAEWFPAQVSAMTVSGDRVRIVFSQRPGLAVWPYGPGVAPIQPAHFWKERIGSITTAEQLSRLDPTGLPSAGAFEIVARSEGASITLEPYPEWPGWVIPPEIASVTFVVFESIEAGLAAVEDGSVDVVIDPEGFDHDIQVEPPLARMVSETNGFRFLAFNLARPVTSNRGFREAGAILAAATRPAGAELGGGVTLSTLDHRWYDADASVSPDEDLSDPVAVLEESGFGWEVKPTDTLPGSGLVLDGEPVRTLEILVPVEDPVRLAHVRAIAERLTHLGFDIQVVTKPLQEVVDGVFLPGDEGFDFDMYAAGWSLGSPDFPGHHRSFFGSPGEENGRLNNTGFSSAELDGLLDDLDGARDPQLAKNLVWGIEAIIADQRPYVILYTPPMVEVYRSDRIAFPFDAILGGVQASGGAPDVVQPLP